MNEPEAAPAPDPPAGTPEAAESPASVPPEQATPPVVRKPPRPLPATTPEGCGCILLAMFFWLVLGSLFTGCCRVVYPVDPKPVFLGTRIQAPDWVGLVGLIFSSVGAVYLAWRAGRAWSRSESAMEPERAQALGCGLVIAIVAAAFLFLFTVCA